MRIIDVITDTDATQEEIRAIEDACRKIKLEAQIKPQIRQRGILPLPLVIAVSVPSIQGALYTIAAAALAAFPVAFGKALGESAGKEVGTRIGKDLGAKGYAALKWWFGELDGASERGTETQLQDQTAGVEVSITKDLPDEAFAQLEQLDLTGFRGRKLLYDREKGSWEPLLSLTCGDY